MKSDAESPLDILKPVEKLVADIIRAIVTEPEEVIVGSEIVKDERGNYTQLTVKVAKADRSVTIGAKGATAIAISKIAMMAANNLGFRKPLFVQVIAPVIKKEII